MESDRNGSSLNRRVMAVWALLFFNVIEVAGKVVVPIPHTVGRVATQAALIVALPLAYTVNRRLTFRPNVFLAVVSVLALGAFMISVEFGTFHGDLRGVRFVLIVLILWLLTPWWGRQDLMMARMHLQCLEIVLGTVVLGLIISPHTALNHGRLGDSIWPIPPTQVAHYAAVTAGISAVMFLTNKLSRRQAGVLFCASVVILLLTHTRTATVAMAVGIVVAAISLVTSHTSARKAVLVILLLAALAGGVFRSEVTAWATRGESTTQLSTLTGRTRVWTMLETAPRTESQILFGFGLSNGSFDGLPVDNSWLDLYQELGLFGGVLGGLMVLVLILLALRSPRGPARAVALFLIVYCSIASFTETGLGLPSPYVLDLTVAAALLAPAWQRRRGSSLSPPPRGVLPDNGVGGHLGELA